MDVLPGKQRQFPAVAIVTALLVLCIIPGQQLVAKQFPAVTGLIQIKPTLVFLDIPTPLPIAIDMVITPVLFLLIYALVILLSPARRHTLQRVKAACTGLLVLVCCMLTGSLIYYLAKDHLSTQVLTGINSFGINADIHLPYPGYETISLRGSLIVFVCFMIGLFIFLRKISKAPVEGLTREQRMTPYERMLQERRMQQKQQQQPVVKVEKPAAIIPPDRNRQSGLCYCQPVIRFKPEALYYMPV